MEDLPVPLEVKKHTKKRNGRNLHSRLNGGGIRREKGRGSPSRKFL